MLQDKFRLPSEEEIRKLVIPEDCCAFYSMQYAEQRLKDAGYGKSIKNLSDEEDEDDSEKILDDEVRIAPWTLTRTFSNALRGFQSVCLPGFELSYNFTIVLIS